MGQQACLHIGDGLLSLATEDGMHIQLQHTPNIKNHGANRHMFILFY